MRLAAIADHERTALRLGELETALLNRYQRGLPLLRRPFAVVGAKLGCSEERVLETLRGLQGAGIIARVGPVFRPHSVGFSTLAAAAVPAQRLEAVAGLVNEYPQVNHNYEREHRFNLWFVVTGPDRRAVAAVVDDIRRRSGLPVIDLPLLTSYHIDLGFALDAGHALESGRSAQTAAGLDPAASRAPLTLSDQQRRLVAEVQQGLALVRRPFATLAAQCGQTEADVVATLSHWLRAGVVRRLGLVVRHHELGYQANAMVVWSVPDGCVDELGACFAKFPFVTLCYRRPRIAPHWSYNLFCMIHGQQRATVLGQVDALRRACGSAVPANAVLFSVRRFKQCGARYADAQAAAALPTARVPGGRHG